MESEMEEQLPLESIPVLIGVGNARVPKSIPELSPKTHILFLSWARTRQVLNKNKKHANNDFKITISIV